MNLTKLLIVLSFIQCSILYSQEYVEKKYYYENGNIKEIIQTLDGNNFHGDVKEYFENGQLKGLTNYENGKKNGNEKRYEENGVLWRDWNWKNGQKSGINKSYVDGRLVSKQVYSEKDNSSELTEYDENGNIEEIRNFPDFDVVCSIKRFSEDGTLLYKGFGRMSNRVGFWSLYNKDGSLKEEGNYKDRNKTGDWKFFKNGKLESIVSFKDNVKNGLFKFYYGNGNLKIKGEYINGKIEGILYSFSSEESNLLSWDAEYTNNKKNGFSNTYHANKQLKTKLLIENNLLVKVIETYDINGIPLNKGTLSNGNGTILIYDNDIIQTIHTVKNGKIIQSE